MRLKTIGIGIILLGMAGCASLHQMDQIDIYRKTQSYENFSFDEVWTAALRSIDEIEFIVRNAIKETGLIHAVAKTNRDPRFKPPLVNVVIGVENGMINVNFHVELPGQIDGTGQRKACANRFFRVLKNNLKKAKKK